jgi:predicted RNA-binding protein with PUA-like domain
VTPRALLGTILRMPHWLVKQEPDDYSWGQFVKEGSTSWTGVRNFQARNNLRAMKLGDWVLYYHSGAGKEIVGLACVKREAYPDPTADEGDWVSVDLKPVRPLVKPVGLGVLKADRLLMNMAFVKQSRLSVSPVLVPQFNRILELSSTKLK